MNLCDDEGRRRVANGIKQETYILFPICFT